MSPSSIPVSHVRHQRPQVFKRLVEVHRDADQPLDQLFDEILGFLHDHVDDRLPKVYPLPERRAKVVLDGVRRVVCDL